MPPELAGSRDGSARPLLACGRACGLAATLASGLAATLEALLRAAANADEPTNELIPETTPSPGVGRWPAMPRMAATPSTPASAHA